MNAFLHVKMISVSFIWHIQKVRPEDNTFVDPSHSWNPGP